LHHPTHLPYHPPLVLVTKPRLLPTDQTAQSASALGVVHDARKHNVVRRVGDEHKCCRGGKRFIYIG
jgi:hypothetical protein